MMENLLEIGQIVNTHGLRGDVKVMPWCDDPAVFHELAYVMIDGEEFDIEKSSLHKNAVLLKKNTAQITIINLLLKLI